MFACQIIVPRVENALQTQIQSISIAVPEMTPNIMPVGMQRSTKSFYDCYALCEYAYFIFSKAYPM